MKPRPGPLITASIPVLVAIFVGKLWITGTLGYYVNSRTEWIVLLGAVLFALVGLVAIRAALTQGDPEDHFSWRSAVFLLPVLVGIFFPANPLSAASGQSSSLGSLQLTSHVSSGGSGDTFGYWVASVGSHSDASWWAGQRVTLVGFSSPQSGLPRGFIVGRYLVTCCVVDATLLGFPVQLAAGEKKVSDGSWVQVSGVFGKEFWTDQNGGQWPIIENAHISRVSIPASPYLSP